MHFFFLKKFTVFENVDESLNSITFTAESNWKGEGGGVPTKSFNPYIKSIFAKKTGA